MSRFKEGAVYPILGYSFSLDDEQTGEVRRVFVPVEGVSDMNESDAKKFAIQLPRGWFAVILPPSNAVAGFSEPDDRKAKIQKEWEACHGKDGPKLLILDPGTALLGPF